MLYYTEATGVSLARTCPFYFMIMDYHNHKIKRVSICNINEAKLPKCAREHLELQLVIMSVVTIMRLR